MIQIQTEDFSVQTEYDWLRQANPNVTGAICTFTGLVRDFGDKSNVEGIFLEHYPGLTENCLREICEEAKQRWSIHALKVIHRVGKLSLCEQIVFVGVSASHRADAFTACEFIMDYLKAKAPFWKKECHPDGDAWVEAKNTDQQRLANWKQASE